jgi:hypothetical protein
MALLVALVVLALLGVGYQVWDVRSSYGPLTYGSLRWRREYPRLAAEARARRQRRELHAALTAEDREWLLAQGWRP